MPTTCCCPGKIALQVGNDGAVGRLTVLAEKLVSSLEKVQFGPWNGGGETPLVLRRRLSIVFASHH